MSKKHLKHIIQKYPDLMLSLSTNVIKKHVKYPTNRLDRVLRRSLERTSRYRSTRKPSNTLLRLILSKALSCSVCDKIFTAPVTLECGDTFCRDCLLETTPTVCPKCGKGANVEEIRCNVLVQELVNRLMDYFKEKDCQSTSNNQIMFDYVLRNRSDNISVEKKRPLPSTKRKKLQLFDASSQLTKTIAVCDNSSHVFLQPSDLDCVLCSRCLFEPVTTSCGHTFCRCCLARVLDYGLACPLCMSALIRSGGEAELAEVCHVLDLLIRKMLPKEYAERERAYQLEILAGDEELHMPVFICTSAFPGVACPLYVSEPRYRLLTRRCLQTNRRRFAMAAAGDGERFASFGTVLEVRDAVHFHDGTSILTTVGLRRFRVVSRGEKDGYDTAKIEYIHDHPIPRQNLLNLHHLHNRVYRKATRWVRSLPAELHSEIEQSLGAMPPLESTWTSLPDGPAWSWWLMPVLPLSPALQLGFLSTLSLEKRLRAIDKLLERMSVKMRARGELGRVKATAVTTENEDSVEESCGHVSRTEFPSANAMEF